MSSFLMSVKLFDAFFFFFSSRRRHTRSDRDWSSDVCSSDLSAVDYAALVAFNCMLWILAAGLRVGFAGEIDYAALLVYLATVPLVLAAALLVALVYGAQQRLLAVAIALTASDPVFELTGLVLPYLAAPLGGLAAAATFL